VGVVAVDGGAVSSRYARDTKVPVTRSKAELEHVLTRYGCDAFVSGWNQENAMVQFSYQGRNVKVIVPYPKDANERDQRQRWRILLLLVKAQLEAVECGLMKFEEAFLPWMVLKNGLTAYEVMAPEIPAPKLLKEANRR
jgi:hypothetical protein